MADQPNERADDSMELRTGDRGPLPEGAADSVRKKPRPSIRWVQLAYDLEQYGDPDPDERGEVF